jgi:hypothetical protein
MDEPERHNSPGPSNFNRNHNNLNITESTDESFFINQAVNKNLFFKHFLKEEKPFGDHI